MKLQQERQVPFQYRASDFSLIVENIERQLNGVSEGKISAIHNAYTAAPTSGDWKQGDFIRNSAPSEAGSAGSKHVVFGWICTVSGSPGTWLPCRFLTGN